jgi:hypothetical protein
MGFKQRIWADLKRLPAVRYVLDIFNVKVLSLFQIAETCNSALTTGIDDITDFLSLTFCSCVGEITRF